MAYVDLERENTIAVIKLNRGKVNALNHELVNEVHDHFEKLEDDDTVRSIVLTGCGAFFSFGFDIPGLYDLTREAFTEFLVKFTDVYRYLFLYPKPLVAAINGHAIAGGCMLATACDYRLMVSGKAKISLNEIAFGATVFQSAVEILKYWVGPRTAQDILFTGDMYSADQARDLGLIDGVVSSEELLQRATALADSFRERNLVAHAHMKKMLRLPVIETAMRHESATIEKFVDIWYSDTLRENLRHFEIRS
ncbi:MAG: enoyl-CoA hydratase/isomerase family protein [Candidatus Zixiibacteriota bacterium]|nr:MAG: enoyl-CoA hydratase/isomerase family protein [candidate division Zixibacteria bacterium]